jgi:hypothetical protein
MLVASYRIFPGDGGRRAEGRPGAQGWIETQPIAGQASFSILAMPLGPSTRERAGPFYFPSLQSAILKHHACLLCSMEWTDAQKNDESQECVEHSL